MHQLRYADQTAVALQYDTEARARDMQYSRWVSGASAGPVGLPVDLVRLRINMERFSRASPPSYHPPLTDGWRGSD